MGDSPMIVLTRDGRVTRKKRGREGPSDNTTDRITFSISGSPVPPPHLTVNRTENDDDDEKRKNLSNICLMVFFSFSSPS